VNPSAAQLLRAVSEPLDLRTLEPGQWNSLLRNARRANLLYRLSAQIVRFGLLDLLPDRDRDDVLAVEEVAAHHRRGIQWETNRLRRALRGTGVAPVLLKGAAYVMADLPVGWGRVAGDIDILVPRASLAPVEQALRNAGWEPLDSDDYDDHYYRTWMHELPPLCHGRRGTILDVHHTILPLTGRVHPDAELLVQSARPLAEPGFSVLTPEDMVLHSAAHLFQDGEVFGGLRDLTDLDLMLRHFGQSEPGFWDRLTPRAEQLQLTRPLYYALRFTTRLLGTPVPGDVLQAAGRGGPGWLVLSVMDALATRVLVPEVSDGESWSRTISRFLLYVRSHWLRMPPGLLVQHLSHKAMKRYRQWRKKEQPG
jgi:hypothetical protein